MNNGGSILLILDGDLPSLVVAALAAEARLVASAPTPTRAVTEVLPSEGAPMAWCVGNGAQLEAAAEIAAQYDIRVVARSLESGGGAAVEGTPAERSRSLRLVAAATAAARLGCRRLIWPVQAIGGGVGEGGDVGVGGVGSLDVERVANLLDVATLVGRLVSIETGCEVSVETPFVDLTDQQLVELALDMGLDREQCWWAAGGTHLGERDQNAAMVAEASQVRQRWEGAFARSGWPATPIVRTKAGQRTRA